MPVSLRLVPILGAGLLSSALILIPLLATLWISFTAGLPGEGLYTLENYAKVVSDPFGYRVLLNTLVFALGSTAIAVAIGAPLAWAVARTDLPFKHGVSLAMGLVLVIPGFIQSIGWAMMLSPSIGLISRLFTQVLGFTEAPFNIYTLGGMSLVQGLGLVPEAFFILLPVLMAMDVSFEEAAYLSGASKLRTFLRIDMALALPALTALTIYIFVLASTLFEVPAILGYPERLFVFSTMVFLIVTAAVGLPAYGLAAAYGTVIIAISLALMTQYARILKGGRQYATVTGKGRRATILRLRRWRVVALGLVLLYLALAVGLPLLTLIYFSLLPFSRVSAKLGRPTRRASAVPGSQDARQIGQFGPSITGPGRACEPFRPLFAELC